MLSPRSEVQFSQSGFFTRRIIHTRPRGSYNSGDFYPREPKNRRQTDAIKVRVAHPRRGVCGAGTYVCATPPRDLRLGGTGFSCFIECVRRGAVLLRGPVFRSSPPDRTPPGGKNKESYGVFRASSETPQKRSRLKNIRFQREFISATAPNLAFYECTVPPTTLCGSCTSTALPSARSRISVSSGRGTTS
jgi:hypothetical protein